MGDLLKKPGQAVASKVGLWLLGLLGLGGGIGLIFLLVFMLIILAVVGGVAGNQANEESAIGGGRAICSPSGELNKELWDANWANMGVIKDQGDTVLRISEEKGIDPVLFSSILALETGWGTSSAIVNKKNPGGLMDPSTGSKVLYSFATYEDGLESMGKTLYNRIIVDGLTTIEDLGNVYAPVGADNDPNGTNEGWIPSVTEISSQFGGLTMNCEAGSEVDFSFEGDVSELRKSLATTGEKWLGRPYFWAGGRTPDSVARGEFDCSSFVHWVYKQNGIELGHMGSVSTDTLKHLGKKITMDQIKVGDLIFWDTYKIDGHVGIYVGNGKFIGAQSSGGVSIVEVNNSYWQSVFSGHVRRIVND